MRYSLEERLDEENEISDCELLKYKISDGGSPKNEIADFESTKNEILDCRSPEIGSDTEKNPFDFMTFNSDQKNSFLSGLLPRNDQNDLSYQKNNFFSGSPDSIPSYDNISRNMFFSNEPKNHILNTKEMIVSETSQNLELDNENEMFFEEESQKNIQYFLKLLNTNGNCIKFGAHIRDLVKQPVPVEFSELEPNLFKYILLKILKKTDRSSDGFKSFINWLFDHRKNLDMFSALEACYSTLEDPKKNTKLSRVSQKKKVVLDFLLMMDEEKTKRVLPRPFSNHILEDLKNLLKGNIYPKKIGDLWRFNRNIIMDEALKLPINDFKEFSLKLFDYSPHNSKVIKFFWEETIDKKIHPIVNYVEIINDILNKTRPKFIKTTGRDKAAWKIKINYLEQVLEKKLNINAQGKRIFQQSATEIEEIEDFENDATCKKLKTLGH